MGSWIVGFVGAMHMAADGTRGGSNVEPTTRGGPAQPNGSAFNAEPPTGGRPAQSNGSAFNGEPVSRAPVADVDPAETREWLDALESVLQVGGVERAQFLLPQLKNKAVRRGVRPPFTANTPYINTIPVNRQPLFRANRELERRIKNWVRWNAMTMVVQANKSDGTLGGHISTFASSATLYEVGF